MPVTDFECQIARGQIGRYLGGDALSTDAMRGLEEHLAECPGCKAVVAERRAELLGMLPTHAAVSIPVAKSKENPLVAALRARAEREAVEEPPKPVSAPRYANAKPSPKPIDKAVEEREKPAPKALGKPLALAALLAVVLVGMSRLTHGAGGGALGPKAADGFAASSFAETSKPAPAAPAAKPETAEVLNATRPEVKAEVPMKVEAKPTAPKSEEPVAKSEIPKAAETTPLKPEPDKKPETKVVEKKPVLKAAPKPVATIPKVPAKPKPAVKPSSKSKPAARRPAAHKAIVRKRAPAPRPAVRVYGPDGKPLQP